jgi:hypothetical protein
MPEMENDQQMAPDEKRVRDALKRLQEGIPEDARNRELVAKSIRLHGRIRINTRMVCREASFSPTTVYKRFPWLQELLTQDDEDDAPPPVITAVSDVETIAQQAAEIASLKKTVAVLQAENHQLAQANIALEERSQGADLARQAAIDAGRRRKADAPANVSPIR